MPPQFDLVIRNGTVITAADTTRCDVGIKNGKIEALARVLGPGAEEIDATGRLVLPGGIDSHVHFEQDSPESGARPAADFFTGSRSAACGGTTCVIPFARQIKGHSLRQAVADYHKKSDGKSAIDYAFHLIVADPTPQVLGQELPALIRDGYTSIKVYMTYDALKLADRDILEVLALARREGVMPMVHAENADCIDWLTKQLLDSGRTHPRYKRIAHAGPVEREATHRAITLAELVDVPLLIVHVATGEAAEQIATARRRGLKVFGETCPQYLFLTERDIDKEGMEGAKCICAPPPGTQRNQDALWRAMETGVFQVYSSDHAPYRYDDPRGKLVNGPNAPFNKITNGVPGVETRLPLLFSGGVQAGRIDIHSFVAMTATNPAKIYGLYPRKGTVAVGSDADLAIWNPDREVTITTRILHDDMDYTPYDGHQVRGWPEITLSRGALVCRDFEFLGNREHGAFLPCGIPNLPKHDDALLKL